jgi:hypothetical protein
MAKETQARANDLRLKKRIAVLQGWNERWQSFSERKQPNASNRWP